jgi:hypothetical protein
VSASCWSLTTSSDCLAKNGRYAFIATVDAPNPTLASMAKRAETGQIGDEEGRMRNSVAAKAPMKANPRRRRFLNFAANEPNELK